MIFYIKTYLDARKSWTRIWICRDFAVLFCAMARHQGIPTRTRVGFATYIAEFGPDFSGEHEIAEYWDSSEKRWRLVDPGQNDVIIRLNNVRFDTTDIPRDKYLVAGQAWQMCRAGEADPENSEVILITLF